MSDTKTNSCSDCGASLGFLLLRVWLGLRALFSGIEKFAAIKTVQIPLLDADGNPDPSGAIVEVEKKFYAFGNYHAVPDALKNRLAEEPLLPSLFTAPFYVLLGVLLIVTGLTLLAGAWTRCSLLVMGLIYAALTVGLVLLKQDAGVAWLAIHIGLIAYALHLSKYNRYTLTRT